MSVEMIKIPVLDHGYLASVDVWGSDERIIEAARMSTGKGFLGWGHSECIYCGDRPQPRTERPCPNIAGNKHEFMTKKGDEQLLRYLWENKHHTPFEMAGMTIEVQAPIFVFREWHRHRVPFGYNEMSSRYVPLPDVNYVPTVERLMANAGGANKQAGTVKGSKALDEAACDAYRQMLEESYGRAEHFYQWALSQGVPKELARVHLPVGRYSRMRATSNLRGWLGFLSLRMAPNAQYEIRIYAEEVGKLIATSFPRTWALFAEKKA